MQATKADADKDGVKVPTTLAEYCVTCKPAQQDDMADLYVDDYMDDLDDEEDEEDEIYETDEDDSGNGES